ncbi:MAG: hypothetical protein WC836_19130 [Desulfobacula sp.]
MALGNTSFFGFPAIVSFFGEDYLSYAIIYDQFGSFLALAIFGTLVVSVYGTEEKVSCKEITKRVFGFPPFLALVIGFLLMKITYPSIMVKILEGLSATLIPLVIFSVGAQLRLRQPCHPWSCREFLHNPGRLNPDVANAAIGYGLILAFITLPFFYYLLKIFR